MTSTEMSPIGDAEPMSECLCREHLSGPLHVDQHDKLLAVEAGGVAAIAELLASLVYDQEGGAECHQAGTLRWFEFGEFVSLHNWQDPIGMHRLASNILWALRRISELERHTGL